MCAAIRATLFQHFAADGAELAACGIALFTRRAREDSIFDGVAFVCGAIGIRAESALYCDIREWARDIRRGGIAGGRGIFAWNFESEVFRELEDGFIIQLRAVARFEHREGGLLAADFLRKHTLRYSALSPCISDRYAKFSIQVSHICSCLPTADIILYFAAFDKGGDINSYQPLYQLINKCL